MRISKIVCDGCGKEIKENPVKVLLEKVDRETGDFKEDAPVYAPDKDFCDECMERIKDFIERMGERATTTVKEETKQEEPVKAPEPEDEKTAPEQKPEPKPPKSKVASKKQGKPTVKELILEGRSKQEVMRITECSPGTYDQTKYMLKKSGATIPEEKPVKTYKCSEVGKKCVYHSKIGTNITCDYINLEGHRRGCDPEACTRFKKM